MALHTKGLSGIKKVAVVSVLLAVGLVLNLLEGLLPVFAVLPGAKLGLANVTTMVALVLFGPWTALLVGLLRTLLTGVLTGAVTMFAYGGTGTLLSVAAMTLLSKVFGNKISLIGQSMAGAFFFNVGQILVASLVVHNWNMFRYLPVLTLISTVCALLTGFIALRAVQNSNLEGLLDGNR